jgi:SAM-dependent methyltransferase
VSSEHFDVRMNSQLTPGVTVPRGEPDSNIARLPKRSGKDTSGFLLAVRRYVESTRVDTNATVLVVGGMPEDVEVLRRCGFNHIVLSNIEGIADDWEATSNTPVAAVDVENIRLPDDSYDIVVAHEVIHHCRCPHRALCEMLRVAKRRVLLMEPNDSAFMRLLCWLRFSYPFELAAVVDNDYVCGGVRNSQIPNFIFRWNEHEICKATSSFLAEQVFLLHADPYWDFNVQERDLAYREQTRIGTITGMMGVRNFIRLLRAAQTVLNRVPFLRSQGNKFFCGIEKNRGLRPWLTLGQNGQIVFDRTFQRKLE